MSQEEKQKLIQIEADKAAKAIESLKKEEERDKLIKETIAAERLRYNEESISEETKKRDTVEEFEKIIGLAEDVSKDIQKWEQQKLLATLGITLLSIILIVNIFILYYSIPALEQIELDIEALLKKGYTESSSIYTELVEERKDLVNSNSGLLIFSAVLLLILPYAAIFWYRSHTSLRKEKAVMKELFELVEGLMQRLEHVVNPFEATYFRMKMSRLRF